MKSIEKQPPSNEDDCYVITFRPRI